MRDLTRNNLQRKLAIIVNGSIRMAPTIQAEVGRDLIISGKFTKEEIKFLMDSLGSGLVQPLKKPGKATTTKTDLERFQAMQNFQTAYQKFPASMSLEREGSRGLKNASELKPFSWRVAILPFIGHQELFEQYRFDEPWDSEANSKLLPQMPVDYRSPTAPDDQPAGNANYQGIADGTGAIGQDKGVRIQDIRDGTANTLLLIETKTSVPWTKPQDLDELPDFDDDATLQYAMADGSTRTMKPIDRDKLKAMITINGGETIQP